MGIEKDQESYSHIINCYARVKDLDGCEKVIDEMKENGMLVGMGVYNGLIMVHAKLGMANEARKILKEMEDEGLKPDIVCYTSVIHAFAKQKDLDECWRLFDEASLYNDVDEFLYSYMIRLCAASHDAEKALRLYDELQTQGYIDYAPTYNSIIKALASRKMYAADALEIFHKM